MATRTKSHRKQPRQLRKGPAPHEAPRSNYSDVSRQRMWQKAQVSQGRCAKCGQPREHYATLCDAHQEKSRQQSQTYNREVRGCEPW